MPSRRAALIIGLLSLAASAGSLVVAWQLPDGDAAGLTGGIVLIVIAVLTAIWGLAHLIPLKFGAAFPRRPK